MTKNLTFENAALYYDYVPETGQLVFKFRGKESFPCPQAYGRHLVRVGKPAGSKHSEGYIKVSIYGVLFLAHRVAWLLHYGELPKFPEYEIDHINGDRTDNRIENLRAVTSLENKQNLGLSINNKSGIKGVCWSAAAGKWQAQIRLSGKTKYLGVFDTIKNAAEARLSAEAEFGFLTSQRLSFRAGA